MSDTTYLSRANVAWADHMLHFARHKQFFELLWEGRSALWDVNIADD